MSKRAAQSNQKTLMPDTSTVRAGSTAADGPGSLALSLSIVIVTWNAKQYTCECLESLENQWPSRLLQIIVVDNASSDGTESLVHEKFPQVMLIQSGSNVGFAKGNNLGIRKSTGKYLFLINSDVHVLPGCLRKMVDFMEEHPDIGMLGPQMLDRQCRVARSAMRFPTVWNVFLRALALERVFKRSRLFGGYLMSDFPHDRIADVEVLNGWFWMIRRQSLDQVGLLDESFFMYSEDIDWCKRFRENGWRLVFFPRAQAIHYGGASSTNAPVRFYLEKLKASNQYFRKHHGRLSLFLYRVAIVLHESLRLCAYLASYVLQKPSRAQAGYKIRRSAAGLAWMFGLPTRWQEKWQ